MRNWLPEEIRARGFDPATGARLDGYPLGERSPKPAQRCDPGCCCRICRRDRFAPKTLSASARSWLKPEQLLQVQVIEELRPRLVAGAKLIAINGELPGGGRLFQKWQTIRQAMGYEAGTPDLMAIRGRWVHFVELKRQRGAPDLLGHRKARGELSGVQRDWRDWATAQDCPWAVCRSVAEVEQALTGWGLIDGP